MSEYQYVHFIAVDKPLTDKELAFMERQSSRAEITRRSFINEYHFGDFRGNAAEMLRHGYDVHLHFSNFGIRKVMLRLPHGLPCDKRLFKKYLPEQGVEWLQDKKGPAGILTIEPEGDAGSYDYLDNVAEITEALVAIRHGLMQSDLRPLYVAWLACGHDENTEEPPVPAGLDDRSPALNELGRFYELSSFLLDAAAEGAPKVVEQIDTTEPVKIWLASKSSDEIKSTVEALLKEDSDGLKMKLLAEIRDFAPASVWPVSPPSRTYGELLCREVELEEFWSTNEAIQEQKRRTKYLKSIADNPKKTEEKIFKLVVAGGRDGLDEAASLLSDFANAVSFTAAKGLAEKLLESHGSVRGIKTTLKRHGFL